MNTGAVIYGNHGFFFKDGGSYTVPSSGTAGRNAKPGAADTAWVDMGIIEKATVQHNRDTKDIFAPTPGVLRMHDRVETKRQIIFKLTGVEMSPLMFEMLFGTLSLTSASTQYNPLEGGTKRGWIKIQQYDQTDTLRNTVDMFCHIQIDGEVSFSDDIVKADYTCTGLHSIYNTGTLS